MFQELLEKLLNEMRRNKRTDGKTKRKIKHDKKHKERKYTSDKKRKGSVWNDSNTIYPPDKNRKMKP